MGMGMIDNPFSQVVGNVEIKRSIMNIRELMYSTIMGLKGFQVDQNSKMVL